MPNSDEVTDLNPTLSWIEKHYSRETREQCERRICEGNVNGAIDLKRTAWDVYCNDNPGREITSDSVTNSNLDGQVELGDGFRTPEVQ